MLGDTWFDTGNKQLYVYNGTTWTLIGPTSVAGSGVTQMITEVVQDDTGVNKSVIKAVTNDTVVFVISETQFTPSSTETNAAALIAAGFATVFKGITPSSSISDNRFQGTVDDSDKLGGIAAANYMRSNTNDTTTGTLGVLNDSGITVGAGSDITMSMTGDNFKLANSTANGDIIFQTTNGSVASIPLMLDGSTGRAVFSSSAIQDLVINGNLEVKGTQVINNTTTLSVEDNIIELNRNISSNAGMPSFSGLKVNRGETSSALQQDLYWVWDETFADDGTTLYGNAGGAWTAFKSGGGDELSAPTLVDVRANVVHATTTSAFYADLAERYEADMLLEVGDVVILGGHAEVTRCDKELSDAIFGVVSDSPAFLMNAQAGNNESHPMIALKGRVYVKVKGTGKAGDRIVSAGNGEAKVANLDECTLFNVLGRLIKHKYSQEATLIECAIGVK